jgi:pimeloyl-ACP methyl ester carboxylesterase
MAAITALQSSFDLSRLRDPATLRRAVLFGAGWGLAFASAMTALHTYQNECLCIDEAVWYTAVSIGVGIFAFGPITLLKARS